jgi:hypothetical protein
MKWFVRGAALVTAGCISGFIAPGYLSLGVAVAGGGLMAVALADRVPFKRGGLLTSACFLSLVLAGALVTLPPHSWLLGTLFVLVGIAGFAIGVTTTAGRRWGVAAALTGGLAAAGLLLAPTPIGQGALGTFQLCQQRNFTYPIVTGKFTVDCQDGSVYTFRPHGEVSAPGGRILLTAEPGDRFRPILVEDWDTTPLTLIKAGPPLLAAILVAAVSGGLTRRRRRQAAAYARITAPRR